MFRKQFTIKSNANMKTSERKKLAGRLSHGLLGPSDLLPAKAQAALLKLNTFSDSPVNVYSFDKVPLAFEVDDGTLYPTVYTLWKAPELLPTLLIHENVLGFLERGADLMLPGVITRSSREVPFPDFPKGSPVAVSTVASSGQIKGPIVVGRALMSSADMIASGMQGKGVEVVHMYRDCLWELGPRDHPPTTADLGFAILLHKARPTLNDVEFPALGGSIDPIEKATENNDSAPYSGDTPSEDIGEAAAAKSPAAEESDETGAPKTTDESPEELLYRCFLAALIYRMTKTAPFPFDVGQFYSRCLLPCVPEGRRLDMKKTKYKKFSAFLVDVGQNAEADAWLVRIAQKTKGVDVITEVNWAHPDLKRFVLTDERITDEADPTKAGTSTHCAPQIAEGYSVTEPVLALLKSVDSSISKGDYLDLQATRALVTEYVKAKNLNQGKMVSLADPVLAHVINSDLEQMAWNDLIQKILSRMTKTYRIVSSDGRVTTRKGDLPKLTFKVETRSGNKKVTLVNNLTVYGVEPKEFARKIQIGVATSATINQQAPQCEGPQVLIQGNQVDFVGRLLMDDLGVDKKYISGLELAPKKKK